MEIVTMIIAIINLLVWVGVTLMVSAPKIFSLTSDIKKYINVIDDNFVSRGRLYESTLKAWQTIDPECCQKFASKEDEELMSQCPILFSKQVDGWHINHFWFVKLIIYIQLDKYDK